MKAHICIGGPLDGEFASSEDFYGYRQRDEKGRVIPYHRLERGWEREPGMYDHLKNEYLQFNTSSSRRGRCNVIWLHTSRMIPPIPGRKR